MGEGLIKWLLQNRQDAGLVGFMLVTFVLSLIALYKEWIVLGKSYKALVAESKESKLLLSSVNDRLVEQRIINERVTVTIDAKNERIRALELDLARCEGEQPWRQRRERQRT